MPSPGQMRGGWDIKYLVTGVHRSGTSVTAHWIANAAGRPILDDPGWAIFSAEGFLEYRERSDLRDALLSAFVVKCPRACTVLCDVDLDFSGTIFVIVCRDPLDVFSSVLEAITTGNRRPITMLDLHMEDGGLIDGFITYYKRFYRSLNRTLAEGGRVRIVLYEKVVHEGEDYLRAKFPEFRKVPVPQFDFSIPYAPPENKASAGSDLIAGVGRNSLDLLAEVREILHQELGWIFDELAALELQPNLE